MSISSIKFGWYTPDFIEFSITQILLYKFGRANSIVGFYHADFIIQIPPNRFYRISYFTNILMQILLYTKYYTNYCANYCLFLFYALLYGLHLMFHCAKSILQFIV